MTQTDIDRIRAYCAKATTGPWFVGAMNDALFVINEPPRPAPVDYVNDSLKTRVIAKPAEPHEQGWTREEYDGHADFIASARTDLPAAIEALEQLRKDKDRLDLLVNNYCDFKSTKDGNYWFLEADLKGETFRDAIDAALHPTSKSA